MVQQYVHQRQHALRLCCPFQVQGLRPNAVSLEELKMFSLWMTTSQQTQRQSFLPILQLLTVLCTRVIHDEVVLGRLSFIFSIFQLIRSFFLEIKRLQPSRRIFVHGFCSLFLKREVEGCHSVFSQSVQFIFSHVLTSDKLEPF